VHLSKYQLENLLLQLVDIEAGQASVALSLKLDLS